jgi:cytoplasmic tRNA 2-thiolation protein 1
MSCLNREAAVRRPKNAQTLCKECFIRIFEEEVHHTIKTSKLFSYGDKVAIGSSGGKDSTVLASVLKTLNTRCGYGLDLIMLSIDEGIKGYRDHSLETVKRNSIQYDMPLHILSYDQLYGWSMDQVVETVGKRGNCTYCGVFRRQALDRGASMLGLNHLVTGHNADDMAETILMNLLRGDLPRLARSTNTSTQAVDDGIKRSKPLKYSYQKEIVLYAHYKGLDYFSTECIYSPEGFRGTARTLIKGLEKIRPSVVLDIVRSGEDISSIADHTLFRNQPGTGTTRGTRGGPIMSENAINAIFSSPRLDSIESENKLPGGDRGQDYPKLDAHLVTTGGPFDRDTNHGGIYNVATQTLRYCTRCGYMSSQSICQACRLVETLESERPRS